MASPSRYSPSSTESMHKYMILSSEQEVLRRRLSLSASTATTTASPSPDQSMTSSPTHTRPSFTWLPDSNYTTSSNPIPALPGVAHRHNIAGTEDALKLAEVNQEIKATLTELLNTDSCRTDGKYRQYIQGRLMDAEHEIRQQRRRRSSGSNGDKEFASSIAEHLDIGLQSCKTWG